MSLFLTERLKGRSGRARCPKAFSLVEVVLALGVATFAILVIVALLPVGIKSTKDSLDETGAVNVLSQVIADRQATPPASTSMLYGLPALTSTTTPVTNFFGILPNNQSSGANLSRAHYRVDVIVMPPEAGLDPYEAYLKVSWPALANSTNAGSVETVATFPQP
jgi:type II secretory pathway pseudopilin PulG